MDNTALLRDQHFKGRYALGVKTTPLVYLAVLSMFSAMFEVFGVGIFLPIFQFVRLKGDPNSLIEESPIWQYVITWADNYNFDVTIATLLLIAFCCFSMRQLFVYLRLYTLASLRTRIIKSTRDTMFARYMRAETSFHDQMPVGIFVGAISSEVPNAAAGVLAPVELCVHVTLAIFYLCFLTVLSWQMTLCALSLLFVASLLPKHWSKKGGYASKILTKTNIAMSEFILARLRSPRLVRLSGTEMAERKEFDLLTTTQRRADLLAQILKSKIEVVIEPIVVAFSLIFIFVAYQLLGWPLEVIGLYLVIVLRLMPVLKGTLAAWFMVQNATGPIDLVYERQRELVQAEEKSTGNMVYPNHPVDSQFENVSFYYSNAKRPALSNINVVIPAYKTTAIVGPSGSGKSTFIDLLPRLRIPSKGKIFSSGQPLGDFTLDSLRSSIAFAPQEPQIFPGTVRTHILYGKPDASNEELLRATRYAGADQFIETLNNGYDSFIGDSGTLLSGGQKQRLDLARAIISNAPTLILDEPTAGLDPETERCFFQTLKHYQKETETTLIFITHRLQFASKADHIICLVDGKAEGVGTHKQLMSLNGWYAQHYQQRPS